METKKFWGIIGKLFKNQELSKVKNEEEWGTVKATVKIKNVL